MSSRASFLAGVALSAFALAQAPCTAAAGPSRGIEAEVEPAAATPQTFAYRALVIGINAYREHAGAGWEHLNTARGDAEAVAELLRNEYGFSVQTLLDGDATRDAIMAALDGIASLTDRDAVLVYFAGHGHFDERLGEGFWIPADARRSDGARLPTEDWIWNSTITKVLGATKARHVLVVSDACYSGSLFRGGGSPVVEGRDLTWYRRAADAPSRFLITSGDLEPVQDGDGRHSAFAQQILNTLAHPAGDVFSASDLALAVREKVSALTHQLVRMGPLAVASHAGGEFVFVRKGGSPAWPPAAAPAGQGDTARGGPPQATGPSLQDAVLLHQQGATRAAESILSGLATGGGTQTALVAAVASYLSRQSRADQGARLRDTIAQIEKRLASDPAAAPRVKPRVLACLGPLPPVESPEASAKAMLYRIALSSELQARGVVNLVEREALEDVLREMELGTSALSDQQAKLTVGKLLPASFLLVGNVFAGAGRDTVYLRLIDTETSRIAATVRSEVAAEGDPTAALSELAGKLMDALCRARPLEAPARVDGTQVRAALGTFHGAHEALHFELARVDTTGATALAPLRLVRADTFETVFEGAPTGLGAAGNLFVRETR